MTDFDTPDRSTDARSAAPAPRVLDNPLRVGPANDPLEGETDTVSRHLVAALHSNVHADHDDRVRRSPAPRAASAPVGQASGPRRIERSATPLGPMATTSSAAARVQRSTGARQSDTGRLLHTGTDTDRLKRMSPGGGNPKSDPPSRRPRQGQVEYELDEDAELDPANAAPAPATTQSKAKAKATSMRVALHEYRAGEDRVHRKKKTQVAKRSRELAKLKGSVAIAASNVAKGGERLGNSAKHGGLNVGRSIGRLLGMDVKPNTSVTKQTGANTTATASGAYGAVDTEFIEPSFTVKLEGTTWHPILTHLKGTYGKITAPLPAGLAEINGPDPDPNQSEYQIEDLLALDGQDWYMTKAVEAHESIHEDHLHDALNIVGGTIAQLFATLTVDQSVAPTAQDAIAAIKLLPGYDAIMNLADPNSSQIRAVWDAEYVNQIGRDHYGPTINAEADVVEPMVDKINKARKKQKLPKVKKTWTCTNDAGAVQVPKGRRNK